MRGRVIRRFSAATITTLVALATLVQPAAAGDGPTTRWVDNDGQAGPSGCGGESTAAVSVQTAVNVANSGDTILVCPGEYVGTVWIAGKDDLTIRGFKPWTARIVAPAADTIGGLVRIDNVSGTRIQWLEIVALTDAPCLPMVNLIDATGSPDTSIRANHLGALGTDTLGACGFDTGIQVRNGSDGSVVAWNRIIDFRANGIVAATSDDVDVHGNSARYLHAAEMSASVESTGVAVSNAPGARVGRNVVRSLPSAADDTTPRLTHSIHVDGGAATLVANRVSYVTLGIELTAADGTVVRDNTVRHVQFTGLIVNSDDTRIRANLVRDAGSNGVFVDGEDNVLRGNDFRGNALADCFDTSGGTTLQNTWIDNLGHDSFPEGICTAP